MVEFNVASNARNIRGIRDIRGKRIIHGKIYGQLLPFSQWVQGQISR